jgi:hypothetical protein
MLVKVVTGVCLLLILVSGCDDPASTTTASPAGISGRLDAALAMQGDTVRHNALVKLAQDAAEAGDGDVVLKAIEAIDAGTARDNTCAMCSEALARMGRTAAATAVAKQISDETARKNTLSKIASGAIK